MSIVKEKLEYIVLSSLPDNTKLTMFDFQGDFKSKSYNIHLTIDLFTEINDLKDLFEDSIKVENNIKDSLRNYLYNIHRKTHRSLADGMKGGY